MAASGGQVPVRRCVIIYLAQPYSHDKPAVRRQRFEYGIRVAALLMGRGYAVISPVVHSHPIYTRHPEAGDSYDHWAALDETLILASEAVWVLTLDGWEDSYGVSKEIDFAKANGTPVKYIDTNGDEVYSWLAR